MNTPSSRIRGFSLIELMVVIFIIGIIAAFVVPAMPTILKGSQLSQGSQILADQLSLARQYALSKNHPIEVRLIHFIDPEVPGDKDAGGAYRAIQILETLDAVDSASQDFVRVPLDKPQLLPQAVILNKDVLSTVISEATPTSTNSPPPSKNAAGGKDPQLPRGVGIQYDYVWFRFMPDGSTNLPARSNTDPNGAWFITLHNANDLAPYVAQGGVYTGQGAGKRVVNFFTIQIDPVSGSMKQFRPGLAPQ